LTGKFIKLSQGPTVTLPSKLHDMNSAHDSQGNTVANSMELKLSTALKFP